MAASNKRKPQESPPPSKVIVHYVLDDSDLAIPYMDGHDIPAGTTYRQLGDKWFKINFDLFWPGPNLERNLVAPTFRSRN